MISSEMPEIMGMSDRVIVMCQGRVTGEFRAASYQVEIMTCATKFLDVEAASSLSGRSTRECFISQLEASRYGNSMPA